MVRFAPSHRAFDEAKRQNPVAQILALHDAAAFPNRVGDIDAGEGIGAFDDDARARRRRSEGLAGAQGRQRTLETTEVKQDVGNEGCMRSVSLWGARAEGVERRPRKVSGQGAIMKVLGVCGWSGAGKTVLITRLIPLLRESGPRVATIKHAHADDVASIRDLVTTHASPAEEVLRRLA